MHYDSPEFQITLEFGPEVVPANPSVRRASTVAPPTSGTCGPKCDGSSPSAVLQSSLENRLRARMAAYGSPEYALTWKHWDMPSGPPICALRASGRRTSGNGSTGWPTPDASVAQDGETFETWNKRRLETKARVGNGNGFGTPLTIAAQLAGWPTPTKGNAEGSQIGKGASSTGRREDGSKATVSLNQVAQTAGWPTPSTPSGGPNVKPTATHTGGMDLEGAATLAGWPTPMAGAKGTETYNEAGNTDSSRKTVALVSGWATPTQRDYRSESATDAFNEKRWSHPRGKPLGAEVLLSTAQTEKRGALNPAFSLWLMGFPIAWGHCAARVTRSSRKLQRSSSEHT